jgi:hypothetical protein
MGVIMETEEEELPNEPIELDGLLSIEQIDEMVGDYQPPKFETAEQALEAVKKSRGQIRYVPEEIKTLEICLEVAKEGNKGLYKYVPEKFKKEEFHVERMKLKYADLDLAPEEFRTARLYFEMVKAHGCTLINVPEEFKTVDMCAEAIKQEGWTLMFVPESIRDNAMKAAGFDVVHYKYETALEKGIKEIFQKEIERVCLRFIKFVEMARSEGLLSLEKQIDAEKVSKKDFMETALNMAIEARGEKAIKAYCDLWIKENCNNSVAYYEKILASVIKAGVLAIWRGEHPKMARCKIIGLIPRELLPNSLLFS